SPGAVCRPTRAFERPFCIETTGVPAGRAAASVDAASAVAPLLTASSTRAGATPSGRRSCSTSAFASTRWSRPSRSVRLGEVARGVGEQDPSSSDGRIRQNPELSFGATMEKTWFKHYPAGVPATLDFERYGSLVALLDESFKKYASRMAYRFMGKTITFAQV